MELQNQPVILTLARNDVSKISNVSFFFFCTLSLEENNEHILTCWIQHHCAAVPSHFHYVSISIGSFQILGNQATGRSRFNYTSCLSTNSQVRYCLAFHRTSNSQRTIFFATFTFQRILMKLENVWSFNIRRNIILIWSYHTCRVQMKPINSASSRWGFFPPILSLSLLAFQWWRW